MMADHFVTLEIDPHLGIRPTFRCGASDDDDVETSPCRWFCSLCDEACMCGEWGVASGARVWFPSRKFWTNHLDYCRLIEGWFDDDPWELYTGEPGPLPAASGLVEIEWDGDGYTWRFAEVQP